MRGALAAIAVLTAPVASAETVDPRAVKACQQPGASFVQVEQCLPWTDTAILMLDAIASPEAYGAAGGALAEKCSALNPDNIQGAWSCAYKAMESAVRLAQMLPEGAVLDDPLFAGLSDPAVLDQMLNRAKDLRARFPDAVPGAVMYHGLK